MVAMGCSNTHEGVLVAGGGAVAAGVAVVAVDCALGGNTKNLMLVCPRTCFAGALFCACVQVADGNSVNEQHGG